MTSKTIKIATRTSRLAMYQAQYVNQQLKYYYPNIKTKLIPIITTGDKFSNTIFNKNIKRGSFIKELEFALIQYHADIAVHSMKDITTTLPKELILSTICKREDPRDAFVSIKYSNIHDIPSGGTIGTSSLRRKYQISEKRPDLILNDLRGNIDTRIQKLQQGQYDAIILAAAGLHRLQLTQYIKSYFDPKDLLPAMGQGAIAIECRISDQDIISLLAPLNHQASSLRIQAEQAVTTYLESYCQFPIASYSEILNHQIWLRALIGTLNSQNIIRVEGKAPFNQSKNLGKILAQNLLLKSQCTNSFNINFIKSL